MLYYAKLFPTDLDTPDNFDYCLRIWLSQLIENSLSTNPSRIEIRLIQQGSLGFDLIDDGCGLQETDFKDLTQINMERRENQLYKEKSLGYKGEALYSLIRCAEVKIITRNKSQDYGMEITFNDEGQIR